MAPPAHQLRQAHRLRIVAEHEGLHQDPVRARGGVEDRLDVGGVPRHRLFAENVLACFDGSIDHSQWSVFGREM